MSGLRPAPARRTTTSATGRTLGKYRLPQRQIEAARHVFEHLAKAIDAPFALRLWDGTTIPLGRTGANGPFIRIAGPGVLGALLRRPSFDHLFRRYVSGDIAIEGGDLISLAQVARERRKAARLRVGDLRRGFPWTKALPLLLARDRAVEIRHEFQGGDAPRRSGKDKDKDFIQFHYDASNEFYALFLDSEMVYSCAYFRDWSNSLEQAQRDKLELICRKLRLRPGESLLDIGSGWGALLCHAAQRYGVSAHGVTLSQAQYDYAQAKIARLGLQDRVTVSLADYMTLEGRYDKIASIGMYEHVGIANYTAYFKKMHELLARGRHLPQSRHHAPRQAQHQELRQDQPEPTGDPEVHLPGRRARSHRPHRAGDGILRLRDPGRRSPAPALRAHLPAVARPSDRAARRGDRAGRAGALSHVGGLSRRRHRRLRIRAAARVPDGRDQAGRCALAAAADSRGSLPRCGPAADGVQADAVVG